MSSWFLAIIPADPLIVPSREAQAAAARYVRRTVKRARKVRSCVTDHVEFVAAGGNWGGVFCPSCGADLGKWWGDAMSQAYESSRFARLRKRVPCCRRIISLNDLNYPWAVGFARFSLMADEPHGDFTPANVARIETILGCSVRLIRGRI